MTFASTCQAPGPSSAPDDLHRRQGVSLEADLEGDVEVGDEVGPVVVVMDDHVEADRPLEADRADLALRGQVEPGLDRCPA